MKTLILLFAISMLALGSCEKEKPPVSFGDGGAIYVARIDSAKLPAYAYLINNQWHHRDSFPDQSGEYLVFRTFCFKCPPSFCPENQDWSCYNNHAIMEYNPIYGWLEGFKWTTNDNVKDVTQYTKVISWMPLAPHSEVKPDPETWARKENAGPNSMTNYKLIK